MLVAEEKYGYNAGKLANAQVHFHGTSLGVRPGMGMEPPADPLSTLVSSRTGAVRTFRSYYNVSRRPPNTDLLSTITRCHTMGPINTCLVLRGLVRIEPR